MFRGGSMRKSIMILSIALGLVLVQSNTLYASSFEGEEAYYLQYCSRPRNSTKEANVCADFKNYYIQQTNTLASEIDTISNQINAVGEDMEKLSSLMREQQNKLDALASQITEKQSIIDTMKTSIHEVETQIKTISEDIEKRDVLIKERMVSEQGSLGTAIYADYIMGAKDIMDFVRIVDGLQRITNYDQSMIKSFTQDKELLKFKQEEQKRLIQEHEEAKTDIEKQQAIQQTMQDQKKTLYAKYQAQESRLNAEARAIQDSVAVRADTIMQIDTSVKLEEVAPEVSKNITWAMHVGGPISADTFEYPSGGLHLGMDTAADIGTPIVAPVAAIVVFADNPAPTNSGYYYVSVSDYTNAYAGRPAGGGNTVHMISQVNGVTYGLSFFHLAQENFLAYPGMRLAQGEQFALTGNSGNTTGPHSHIEIINLGNLPLDDAVRYFTESNADFSWNTGWNSTDTACVFNGHTPPCRERPEDILPI